MWGLILIGLSVCWCCHSCFTFQFQAGMMVEEDETTLRKARGTAKGRFTRKMNLFKERLLRDDLLDVLESVNKKILDLFHEVEVESDNLIAHLQQFKHEQADVDKVNV